MGDLLLITGDSSADRYASNLVSYLQDQNFSGTIHSAAGHQTKRAGAHSVKNVVDQSVVGFSEVAGSVPYFYRLLHDLDDVLINRPIEAIVLMDFPGFNLIFAWLSRARELEIPLIYYITPQVWAWWQWRIKLLKKWFDQLFVIFPFEETLYRDRGIPARFVGHPMLENRPETPDYDLREKLELEADRRILSFFPGSRDQEVHQHLPIMVKTAQRIMESDDQFVPVFSAAPTVDQRHYRSVFEQHDAAFPVWGADSRSLLDASEVCMLASGTITMEATFSNTPMVVGYRTSAISYRLGKWFSHTEQVAMPNLIADHPFVPEYLQGEFTVKTLSQELLDLLHDKERRDRMRSKLSEIHSTFDQRSPSREVGNYLLERFE